MVGTAVLFMLLAGCGDDDDDAATTTGEEPTQNACPSSGCEVEITEVSVDGDELLVTFSANFKPDIAGNHVHIYWDSYEAGQVSNDAEANGLVQGAWVPTDAYPAFTTQDAVSVASEDVTDNLCVTYGDRDHNVAADPQVDCHDVAEQLEELQAAQ